MIRSRANIQYKRSQAAQNATPYFNNCPNTSCNVVFYCFCSTIVCSSLACLLLIFIVVFFVAGVVYEGRIPFLFFDIQITFPKFKIFYVPIA